MASTLALTDIGTQMHGVLEGELYFTLKRYVETRELKHFVVQERDVSYRFSTHYHDYVAELEKRLREFGLDRLQAADTEYRPNRESLPESLEFTMDAGAQLVIPQRSGATLRSTTTVLLPDGSAIELAPAMHVYTAAAAAATAPSGLRATLVSGMVNTPSPGSVIVFGAQQAFLFTDTIVALAATTPVILFNGMKATLPAGTEVRLARATEFPIDPAAQATVLKSRPKPVLYANAMDRYQPTTLVQRPRPVRDLDFTSSGAYAVYNWELFFHAPLMTAMHLSKNQHFAEAQRWFHYIFDPTDTSDGPEPERFWKVRPFQTTDIQKVEQLLVNLATGADAALQTDTANSIEAWQRAPFRPHVIARYRQQAYMYKTVMAYLDNLIAWGDSLFAQDTGETIDEALMLYVLAAGILGPRPQAIPPKGAIKPQTYDNLRKDLAKFGTVLRDVEADALFDLMPLPASDSAPSPQASAVRSLGKALYFGVPRNDKLLSYWDTLADRLFKIRNSLNLQGVFRQLALFEPPIDPALLARAAAAGLDVSAIVNGLNQPLPLVRFPILLQKALELVLEVKSLGANLLATMEKEDNEALAIIRAKHERAMLSMVEQVKYAQLQEAIKSKEGLQKSRDIAVRKYLYYEMQLGKTVDQVMAAIPTLVELDRDSLEKMKFKAEEGSVSPRDISVDIATDAFADAAGSLNGGKLLSSHEVRESLFLEGAQIASDIANIINTLSSVGHVVPTVDVHVQPWGMGTSVSYGGNNVGNAAGAVASAARAVAERLNFEARRAARIDGFARREREWAHQSNDAAGEITAIFKQIRAAEIREAIADLELRNHREQMKQAAQIEHFLNEEGTEKAGKKTNKALYAYLKREVKSLYSQCFQMAFDVARKAERAMQHELGDTTKTYLQFGYLGGREGLLAGERLFLDLKRMELAYLELNRREYELTKNVSLLQVDPLALLELRATGRCTVTIHEALVNMDAPSHYFRRIKNVAVTIPCVVGPYASVNCTLTLIKSSIRTTPTVGEGGGYGRTDSEDARFDDYHGSVQSIVTSHAQNDPGLFEANLHDERYLPFENAGVISQWQLQLPGDPSAGDPVQFDYETISDVVLHLRYTAREGGDVLGKPARADLRLLIDEAEAAGCMRLFSLRHDFPVAWAAYKDAPKVADSFRPISITLTPQHYPFWSKTQLGDQREVKSALLIARGDGELRVAKPDGSNPDTLGAFAGELKQTKITDAPPFTGEWKAALTADGVQDAWLLVQWGKVL